MKFHLSALLCCIVSLICIGPEAAAQTVLTPKFWTWKSNPPCGVAPDPTGLITNMIRVDCVGSIPSGRPCDRTPPNGTAAGALTAERVLAHRAPNWPPASGCAQTTHPADLNDGNVVISFFNWGRDAPDTDNLFGDALDLFNSDLRFFREQDRIGLDEDFDFPSVPTNFSRDANCKITPGGFSNRTYRHPFLVNAESLNAKFR